MALTRVGVANAQVVLAGAVRWVLTIRERQWGSLQAYGAHLLPVAWHHALADLHARPRSHPTQLACSTWSPIAVLLYSCMEFL